MPSSAGSEASLSEQLGSTSGRWGHVHSRWQKCHPRALSLRGIYSMVTFTGRDLTWLLAGELHGEPGCGPQPEHPIPGLSSLSVLPEHCLPP